VCRRKCRPRKKNQIEEEIALELQEQAPWKDIKRGSFVVVSCRNLALAGREKI